MMAVGLCEAIGTCLSGQQPPPAAYNQPRLYPNLDDDGPNPNVLPSFSVGQSVFVKRSNGEECVGIVTDVSAVDKAYTLELGAKGASRTLKMVPFSRQEHVMRTMPARLSQSDAQSAFDLDVLSCPILNDLMADPVLASDGHTYERDSIEKAWLAARERCEERPVERPSDTDDDAPCCGGAPAGFKRTSPMTGEPVSGELTPNHLVIQMIESLVQSGGISAADAADWRRRRQAVIARRSSSSAAAPPTPPARAPSENDTARRAMQEVRDEVRRLDSTEVQPGGAWYIIDAGWLKHWREYCWEASRADPPGPISNSTLVDADGRPRAGLQRAADYRGVNESTWRLFVRHYGLSGPPIARTRLDIYAPGAAEDNGAAAAAPREGAAYLDLSSSPRPHAERRPSATDKPLSLAAMMRAAHERRMRSRIVGLERRSEELRARSASEESQERRESAFIKLSKAEADLARVQIELALALSQHDQRDATSRTASTSCSSSTDGGEPRSPWRPTSLARRSSSFEHGRRALGSANLAIGGAIGGAVGGAARRMRGVGAAVQTAAEHVAERRHEAQREAAQRAEANREAERLTAEYLRSTDPFTGQPVQPGELRMCGRCRAGPWRKTGCNNMSNHNAGIFRPHDERNNTANRCRNCLWFESEWTRWPEWDGVVGPH